MGHEAAASSMKERFEHPPGSSWGVVVLGEGHRVTCASVVSNGFFVGGRRPELHRRPQAAVLQVGPDGLSVAEFVFGFQSDKRHLDWERGGWT